MSIESRKFKIEAGELFYIWNGGELVKWGDVVDSIDGYVFVPVPFVDEATGNHQCGIMTADYCAQISALLERIDSGES